MADQINVNAIANTLQTKVDLPDGVSQSQCDFVIAHKTPTAQDPTWYRLYKSGWVEQGGTATFTASSSGEETITFPIKMTDTNYSFNLTSRANGALAWMTEKNTRTTTSTVITWNYYSGGSTFFGYNWQVNGIAA